MCRGLMHRAIHGNGQAWGFVIEGYPRTAEQARDFEKNVSPASQPPLGGRQGRGRGMKVERIDLVLLIDCTEAFCAEALADRSEVGEAAVKARLALFKHHTLPMLKYFDEGGKLRVVRAKLGKGHTAFHNHFTKAANTNALVIHPLHPSTPPLFPLLQPTGSWSWIQSRPFRLTRNGHQNV